jgi:hypothetical protein
MAVGGALRAAIRAGRFSAAARESRQQARALRSLNESGFGQYVASGGGGRLPMGERGFSYRPGQFYGEGVGGQVVTAPPMGGGRASMPMGFGQYEAPSGSPMRQPIQAPYEGMRAWPTEIPSEYPGFLSRTAMSRNAAPPWFGRGTPRMVDENRVVNAYNQPMSQQVFRPIGDRSTVAYVEHPQFPGFRFSTTDDYSVPPAFGGPAFRIPMFGNTPTQPTYFFDDLSNPFGRNERMPQWYIDDMMQNWR